MALARVGVKQFITSMADGSQEAAVCALFWDTARQKLLAGFPWKFATRIAGLAEAEPQSSVIYHSGTGGELVTAVDIDPTYDLVGTYNVVIQVTASGGRSAGGKYRVSIDGGATWGDEVSYVSFGSLQLGAPTYMPLPDGEAESGDAGWRLTGSATVTLTFSGSATLVAGDMYRFTITDCASPEYAYAYSLPGDILIGKYLWPGTRSARYDQRVPWKRGSVGGVELLWSDYDPGQGPKLNYVEDVTDASRFTAGFADALAWKLAFEISGPLKAKVVAQDLAAAFNVAINEARSVDFIEHQEDRPPDSEIIAARGYSWPPWGVGGVPPLGAWWPY